MELRSFVMGQKELELDAGSIPTNGAQKRSREDFRSNTDVGEYLGENDEAKERGICKSQGEIFDSAIELGPKFHINERVLVLDPKRTPLQQHHSIENNETPLFEATIKRPELRHVDPLTKKVMSETKYAYFKKRGRHLFHSQHPTPQKSLEPDQEKEWCYLVHFQGWNSRHDRWMTEGEVFHNTPENRKRLGSSTTKVARADKVESAKEKKKKLPRNKKAREDQNGNDDSMADPNLTILINSCTLPFTLQTILIDDRDKITRKVYPSSSLLAPSDPMEIYRRGITMLHVLPSMSNIQTILARFLKTKKLEDLEKFAKERGNSSVNNQDMVKHSDQQAHCSTDTGTEKRIKQMNSNDEASDQTSKKQQREKTTRRPESHKLTSKTLLKIRKKKRKEFALSILGLVDVALPKFLLYTEERQQYAQIMSAVGDESKNGDTTANDDAPKAPKRPSEIYGGEHLLRLFVRLPYLLTVFQTAKQKIDTVLNADQMSETIPTRTTEEDFVDLAGFMSEFIVYLQKNRDECFKERYFAISSDGR